MKLVFSETCPIDVRLNRWLPGLSPGGVTNLFGGGHLGEQTDARGIGTGGRGRGGGGRHQEVVLSGTPAGSGGIASLRQRAVSLVRRGHEYQQERNVSPLEGGGLPLLPPQGGSGAPSPCTDEGGMRSWGLCVSPVGGARGGEGSCSLVMSPLPQGRLDLVKGEQLMKHAQAQRISLPARGTFPLVNFLLVLRPNWPVSAKR
jgi:hypothetical protein